EYFPLPMQGTPANRRFVDCTFQSNKAPKGAGGAISINAGRSNGSVPYLYFQSCLFKDNKAPGNLGGARSVTGLGRVQFEQCVFNGNRAGVSGGGIFSLDSSLYFDRVTFDSNKALGTTNGGKYSRGIGDAVYGVLLGTLPNVDFRFCSSSFLGTSGAGRSSVALQSALNMMAPKFPGLVAFCNGRRPDKLSLSKIAHWRVENNCTA
ncbi:unnamed protein product, partial [Closterium sp. Naga37s-1]